MLDQKQGGRIVFVSSISSAAFTLSDAHRPLDVGASPPANDSQADPSSTDDPTVACDTAADCPVLSCSVKSAAETCTDQGGVAATGSCCE
jgi:hypothetical protein